MLHFHKKYWLCYWGDEVKEDELGRVRTTLCKGGRPQKENHVGQLNVNGSYKANTQV